MKRSITFFTFIASALVVSAQCTGTVTANAVVVNGTNVETIAGNSQTYWVCGDAAGKNFSGMNNTILIESGAGVLIGGSQNAVYYKGSTSMTVFGDMNNLFGESSTVFFDQGSANFIVECGAGNVVFNYDNAPAVGCAIVSIKELDGLQLSVHPNPARNVLYIVSEEAQLHEVRVFDLEGREVQYHSGRTLDNIPVGGLIPGTYFVRINTSSGTGTRRFIKL